MDVAAVETATTAGLRRAGARFAFVHGSRADASRSARADRDLDVAAWWGGERAPAPWDVVLPDGVDLLVLDDAPLVLAGRVALHGRLLFDDDPPARVAWQGDTRTAHLDAQLRAAELARVFDEGRAHGR